MIKYARNVLAILENEKRNGPTWQPSSNIRTNVLAERWDLCNE